MAQVSFMTLTTVRGPVHHIHYTLVIHQDVWLVNNKLRTPISSKLELVCCFTLTSLEGALTGLPVHLSYGGADSLGQGNATQPTH